MDTDLKWYAFYRRAARACHENLGPGTLVAAFDARAERFRDRWISRNCPEETREDGK